MMGMDERTGKLIQGEKWLRQAVRRAVRTSRGTKVMTRWFGSSYLRQLASPITEASVLDLTGEISETIERSIAGVSVETVVDQVVESEMQVSVRVGKTLMAIGV